MSKSEPTGNKAARWIDELTKQKQAFISLFPSDFKDLQLVVPIGPVRVFKDTNGNVTIYQIDRRRTISLIKQLFQFKTKTEAKRELKDAIRNI